MVRGEIFHLPPRRGTRGHEERGARFAVIVQADQFLDLSTNPGRTYLNERATGQLSSDHHRSG